MWVAFCGLAFAAATYLLLGGSSSVGRLGGRGMGPGGAPPAGRSGRGASPAAGGGGPLGLLFGGARRDAYAGAGEELGSFGSAGSAGAGGTQGADVAGGVADFRGALAERVGKLARGVARSPWVRRLAEQERLSRLSATCEKEMPELLDILALGLSAGLSFDASLELYCERKSCALSHEVADAMSLWRIGVKGRSEALEDLSSRVGSPSLEKFCAAVREALAFGSPLAQTLERQADAIRAEQRARTEERIEQVPVRMLVPLGTLVVPAMLLAILGPLLAGSLLA